MFFLILEIISLHHNSASSLQSGRERNLVQVYEMLEEETNCTFLELVSLTDYGNWCGLGNNGREPVDEMDACCKVHDLCYDQVENSDSCLSPHPLLVTYQWKRTGNVTLVCDDCDDHNTSNKTVKKLTPTRTRNKLEPDTPDCSCAVCRCDVELANCLKQSNLCAPP